MDLTALFNLSYGMYVVSAKKGQQYNGQIANTVFQISSDPPTIAVSINRQNLTHEFLQAEPVFTVSVLAKDAPLDLIGRFGFKSGREIEKFAEIDYKLSPGGVPYLAQHCLAYLEAKITQRLDVATHTLFIGQLTEAAVLTKGEPMTYAFYHEVKRGATPPSAPTHLAQTKKESSPAAADNLKANNPKYECDVCGYVYDPALGDPENGVEPGTTFADLPADWVCPICGADKTEFSELP